MRCVIWKPIYSAVENTEFPLGNSWEYLIALPQKALYVFSHALSQLCESKDWMCFWVIMEYLNLVLDIVSHHHVSCMGESWNSCHYSSQHQFCELDYGEFICTLFWLYKQLNMQISETIWLSVICEFWNWIKMPLTCCLFPI